MSREPCAHEAEVLDLASAGCWPHRAEPELRAHVSGCAVCREAALVADAIRDLTDEPLHEARLPDAAVVWHRAQLRARHDLARRAARPLVAAELLAAACAVLLLWGAWRLGAPVLFEGWAVPGDLPLRDAASWLLAAFQSPLVLAAALCGTFLLPAAFYLAYLIDRPIDEQTNER